MWNIGYEHWSSLEGTLTFHSSYETSIPLTITVADKKKSYSYPCNRPWRPITLRDLRSTHIPHSRLTDGGKVQSCDLTYGLRIQWKGTSQLCNKSPASQSEDSWIDVTLLTLKNFTYCGFLIYWLTVRRMYNVEWWSFLEWWFSKDVAERGSHILDGDIPE
jgi:hypothetical protein